MIKQLLISGVTMASVLGAYGALAAQCEGVGARTYAEPTIIHKADDGAVTMLIRSTGATTIISPAEQTGGASWQHCVGLWTVNADKSGGGAGNCYSVDADGDQWIISWEGGNEGGKWAYVSGTGKYAGRSGNEGGWRPGARFGDGLRLTLWDGTCGD